MNTVINRDVAKKVSNRLLECGAVSINTVKPFRYVSGIFSPMYTDNRLIMSYPKVWSKIIDYYIQVITEGIGLKYVDVLSGTATAAIAHTAALAIKLELPMIYVRSSKKKHGKENQIEGNLKKGKKVLVIEDLISTAGSVATNVMAVREAGGSVDSCVAITTSTLRAFESVINDLKIRLFTLTDVRVTLDQAIKQKYLTSSQKTIVELFLSDPSGWGRKMGFQA